MNWFIDVFKPRFNNLHEIKKQLFTRNNPIDWSNKRSVICDFKLAVSLNEVHDTDKLTTWYDFTVQKEVHDTDKLTTWYDFTVQKEHLFLRNIYSEQELKQSERIKDLKQHFEAFLHAILHY